MIRLPFFPLPLPAGLITYPLTFLLSDLATEIFGAKRARLMVYAALGMNLLSYALIQIALLLPSAGFGEEEAFQAIFALSGLRIIASLTAYVIAQVADVQIYAWIKRRTGIKWLWLRNNGSTCLSQLLDTALIDLIFLWWGLGMSMQEVMPIMLFSYAYKALFSVACTPLFYAMVHLVQTTQRLVHAKFHEEMSV